MKFRVIWTLVVFVALSIFAVFTLRRRENPPPKIRDLSGGATIQRERIDRAIETAKVLNVDDAITSLSQYNESYELAVLAGQFPASKGSLHMSSMLADRRISKIFEHLLSLPQKEADAIAQKIFEDKLAILIGKWRNFIKNGGIPENGPPHHATSAGLFLCSFYCSMDSLDSKIQRWNESLKQPEFEKFDLPHVPAPRRLIDPLFHLNLLVISGHRHRKSVGQLNQELESLCRKITADPIAFLHVTQIKMFKWSAETLDTDFTHRTRGVPASGNDVFLELPGFTDVRSSMRLRNSEVAVQCLNCVRTWRDR